MTLERALGGLLALAAAAGLGVQLTMFVQQEGMPLGPLRWLGFFTVWTNLAAMVVGRLAFGGQAQGRRSAQARLVIVAALGAIWLGYAQLIRPDLGETGLQRIAVIILHDVTPPLAVGLWLAGRHGQLRWRDLGLVVAWPALVLLVAEVRGAIEGWYPYGYLNPAAGNLAVTLAAIVGLIGAIGAGLVLLDRKLAEP